MKLLRTVSIKQNETQLKQYGNQDKKLRNWTQIESYEIGTQTGNYEMGPQT